MANFLVFNTPTVPALGDTGAARMYRGDHATAAAAAAAASEEWQLPSSQLVWVASEASFVRHIITTTRSAAAG